MAVEKLNQEISVIEVHDNENKHLQQNFNLFSTCAFQISLICSALAIGAYLNTVIGEGGSPFFIYGFILTAFFNLIICFSLAELASVYPHSSAQIHWTYVLASDNYKRLLSFITGILSCAGWIFACLSSTYVATVLLFALIELYQDFIPKTFHYYLVYTGIFLSGFILNAFAVQILPICTKFVAGIVNIATLFIIITLLVKAPKQSSSFVFKEIVNDSGWSSNGVVFFLGLLPSIASITLFDGAVHMTDEIIQPERNIPLVMVISNSFSAIIAFFAAIVYMFCVKNVDNLTTPVGGQPFVQLMYDSFDNDALTILGVIFLIISFIGSSYLYYCSTSRLVWSFANSNPLPFSKKLGSINKKFKSPIWALGFVTILCLILGCIMFGSSSILNAVLGSCMVCINLSYLIPLTCLLIKTKCSFYRFDSYFNLGKFGMPMNIASVIWVCFIMVWLNFPLVNPVDSTNMNYACVVLGITFLFTIGLWFLYGRKHYEHNIDLKH